MRKPDKQRVQFDFLPEALDRLDALVNETGAASRAEVVRRALVLYDRMLEAEKEGNEIVLKTRKGEEQKVILL